MTRTAGQKWMVFFAAMFFVTWIASVEHKIGTKVGNKAPDLIGKSVDGEILKLSDTRGKVVLLDFWAAWCGPCRRENPSIVQAYKKYKGKKFSSGKGFTVFSVSLDQQKQAWEKAIKEDNLHWPYHISDLRGWNSKFAAIYGVRRIPANFLIDGNGIIIAIHLRGEALEATLAELVR